VEKETWWWEKSKQASKQIRTKDLVHEDAFKKHWGVC